MKIDASEYLDSRNGCTRYPLINDDGSSTEESVWVCDDCGSSEVDEDEHGCFACNEDAYECDEEECLA